MLLPPVCFPVEVKAVQRFTASISQAYFNVKIFVSQFEISHAFNTTYMQLVTSSLLCN